MLKSKYLVLVIIIIGISCNKPKKAENKPEAKSYTNPYEAFYANLNNLKLTDTILVQSQTKIFGCGTAAAEYYARLEEKGLDKFYNKYGGLFSNTSLLEQFEKENNTKILWVYRGRGELFQLKDMNLKNNDSLIQRLLKEKDYISFVDAPSSMTNLDATITILHPKTKTTQIKTYNIDLKHLNWTSVLSKNEKVADNDYYIF